MPTYGGRVSGWAVCPFRRGVASSKTELICFPEGWLIALERGESWRASPRVGSLPSSEVEVRGAVEGLGRETSSEAEIAPRV